jgi:hypothetical protein
MRFLNRTIVDNIPNSKTVWYCTAGIKDLSLSKELFYFFGKELETLGLIVNEGKIRDASFVEAPRQLNGREKNKQIKEGKGAALWNDNSAKKSQNDIGTRCTKKKLITEQN